MIRSLRWGDVAKLRYGKSLRDYQESPSDSHRFRVFGTNGPIGWHTEPLVERPGIIIGRKGAYRGVHYSNEPFFVIDTAYYLEIHDPEIDVKWAYYQLLTVDINRMDSGSAIPSTKREDFDSVLVRIPSLTTQQRIAEILSAYDDLIENNLRRMALLEESARLLYREWFVHLRFPGHEHSRIVDGVPEGWQKIKLGELAEINRETLPSTYRGQIEYVDISAVTPGRINETTIYEFADAPGRARRVVRHGDIIWSCVRPNRRSHAVIWQPPSNLIVSTGFAVITPVKLPTSFLYAAVTADTFVGYLENHAHGAAYPAVLARDFENAEIIVPPPQLVKPFNDFSEPSLAQIQNLRLQNQKLKLARDLLLPRLMRGEIAV